MSIDISKRTKGEWKCNFHGEKMRYAADIQGSYGKDERGIESIRTIAIITNYAGKEESQANAAFICLAVNNHDKLIEALKECIELIGNANADGFDKDSKPISAYFKAKKLLSSIESKDI